MEAPPASLLFNNDEFNCNLVNLDEVDNLLAEMDYEITDEERAQRKRYFLEEAPLQGRQPH